MGNAEPRDSPVVAHVGHRAMAVARFLDNPDLGWDRAIAARSFFVRHSRRTERKRYGAIADEMVEQ